MGLSGWNGPATSAARSTWKTRPWPCHAKTALPVEVLPWIARRDACAGGCGVGDDIKRVQSEVGRGIGRREGAQQVRVAEYDVALVTEQVTAGNRAESLILKTV